MPRQRFKKTFKNEKRSHNPLCLKQVEPTRVVYVKDADPNFEGPYKGKLTFQRGKQKCTVIAYWPVIPTKDIFLYSIDGAPWSMDDEWGSIFELSLEQSKKHVWMEAKPCTSEVLKVIYKATASLHWKQAELKERFACMDIMFRKAPGFKQLAQCRVQIPKWNALEYLLNHPIASLWSGPLLRERIFVDYWILSAYPRLFHWFPLCTLRRVPAAIWESLDAHSNPSLRQFFVPLCFDPEPWFTPEALKKKLQSEEPPSSKPKLGERDIFQQAINHVAAQDELRREFLKTGQLAEAPQHLPPKFKCPSIPFDCSLSQMRVLHGIRIQVHQLPEASLKLVAQSVFDVHHLHVFVATWMFMRIMAEMKRSGSTVLKLDATAKLDFTILKKTPIVSQIDAAYERQWKRLLSMLQEPVEHPSFYNVERHTQAFQWLVDAKHIVVLKGTHMSTTLLYENAMCIRRILRKFNNTRKNPSFCPPELIRGLCSPLESKIEEEGEEESKKRPRDVDCCDDENDDPSLFVHYSAVTFGKKKTPLKWTVEQCKFLQSLHPIEVLDAGGGTGKTELIKQLRGSDTLIIDEKTKACMPPTLLVVGPTNQLCNLFRSRVRETVSTLHRIIEVLRHGGRERAEWFMQIRVLEVDEAGMIDEWMLGELCRLTTMLPALVKIVFSGDSNQAPSVSFGNCLKDLISFKSTINRTHLTINHRVDEGSLQLVEGMKHILDPHPIKSLEWFAQCIRSSAERKKKGHSGLFISQWFDHVLDDVGRDFKKWGSSMQMMCHTNKMRLKINLEIAKRLVAPFEIPHSWITRKVYGQFDDDDDDHERQPRMPIHLMKGMRLVVNQDRIECFDPYAKKKRTLFKSQRFQCKDINLIWCKDGKRSVMEPLQHTCLRSDQFKLIRSDRNICVSIQLEDLMNVAEPITPTSAKRPMCKKVKKETKTQDNPPPILNVEDCPWKIEESEESLFEVRYEPILSKMELGFGVTVHKMQGLQCPFTRIVMETRSMSKNIFYTGVSRTETGCHVFVQVDGNVPLSVEQLAEKVLHCAQWVTYRLTVLQLLL